MRFFLSGLGDLPRPSRQTSPAPGYRDYWVATASRFRSLVAGSVSPETVTTSSGARPYNQSSSADGSAATVAATSPLSASLTSTRSSVMRIVQLRPDVATATVPVRSGCSSPVQSPASIRYSNSSIPSTANSRSTGTGPPNGSSTSTRWTAVSSAIRRSQKPAVWSSGHHVQDGAAGSVVRNIWSTRAWASSYHASDSESGGHAGGHGSGLGPPSATHAILCSYTSAVCRMTSRTFQPGHDGTAADRSRSAALRSSAPSEASSSRYLWRSIPQP